MEIINAIEDRRSLEEAIGDLLTIFEHKTNLQVDEVNLNRPGMFGAYLPKATVSVTVYLPRFKWKNEFQN